MKAFWIYYNSKNTGNDLKIDEFGWHYSNPDYEFSERRVNNIIHFVKRGICHVTVWQGEKEIKFDVKQGEAFFIRQGINHRYVADSTEGCDRYWLSFSGEKVSDILSECHISGSYSVVKNFEMTEVEKAIRKIKSLITKDNYYLFGMYSEVYKIFYQLAKNDLSKAKSTPKDSKDVLVEAIINYIDKNIGNISVAEIAKKMGYEKSYLYRIFFKKCGMSLQKFVVVRKINYARSLLSSTNMKMEEISEKLGYDCYVSFAKSFKKYAGSSPVAYRKLYKL